MLHWDDDDDDDDDDGDVDAVTTSRTVIHPHKLRMIVAFVEEVSKDRRPDRRDSVLIMSSCTQAVGYFATHYNSHPGP